MATGRAHNRIDLLYTGRYEEARANAILYPGMALLTDANGEVGPNSVAGTAYDVMIALHHQKLGKNIDEAYASGDLIPYIIPNIGDVVNVLIESAEDCTLAEFLTVTNTGTFKVATSTDLRLFKPLEALVGTGSGDRFVKCRRVA